jgi:hypothetical protein
VIDHIGRGEQMRRKILLLYVKHHRYPNAMSFIHGLKHGFLFINGVQLFYWLEKKENKEAIPPIASNGEIQ